MYLNNAPVKFIKGDEVRNVYHTVEADELMDDGWLPESESEPESEQQLEEEEPQGKELTEMTKNELIEYASLNDIVINQYSNKSEILEACLEADNG